MITKEKKMKTIIIGMYAVNIILFLISIIGVLMTPFLFDAPGATQSTAAWGICIFIVSIPIIFVVFTVYSMFLLREKNFKKALYISMSPVVYSTVLFAVWYLVDLIQR